MMLIVPTVHCSTEVFFGPGIRVVFFDPSKHQARQSKPLKPAALQAL